MKTLALLSPENGVQTVSNADSQTSNVVGISGRVSNTHGDNVGVVSGEGCSSVANGRGGSRRGGLTWSLRRLVVVAREEVLDDSVFNELMDQGEDGSTGDTFVHNVERGVENVTDTGLDSTALEEVGNCVGTLFVALGLGANAGGGHTGVVSLLLSGLEGVFEGIVVCGGGSDSQNEWESHQKGP